MSKNIKFYNKVILSLGMNIFVFVSPIFAASFVATVDRSKVSLNDQIELSLTASGGRALDPGLQDLKDFEIKSTGTSSNVQIINGNISSSEVYNYRLLAKHSGKLVIGSITTQIDGKSYSTKSITIEVEKDNSSKNANKNDLVFVTAQVDNLNPYINQQVIYTFRFYRKVQTQNNQLSYPDFKNFWSEDVGKEIQYDKDLNGERYVVTETKKALYPNEIGKLDISPTVLNANIIFKDNNDDFGGIFNNMRSEPKRFMTNVIKLNVLQLPENKPKSFINLIASDLSVTFELSPKNNFKAGDSLTLNIKIKGRGNINDIKKLPLKIKDAKIYEDKSSSKSYLEADKLITEKDFKYSIIPLKKGKLDFNDFKMFYFNVISKKYEPLTTKKISINVNKSDDPNFVESNNTRQNKIPKKQTSIDIADIHQSADDIKDQSINSSEIIFYLLWLIIPVIIYIFLLIGKKGIKLKSKSNKNIYKQVIHEINNLDLNKNENFYKTIFGILTFYLMNRFKIKDLNNLKYDLELNKIPNEYSEQTIKLINQFEYLRFSGDNIDQIKRQEILNSTKSLLNNLEESKK
ncbi:MAG: protein BatD [Candidatus Sericytochromatia bacterium]|nr:protein BatD [Candidatus Sericytochromatia bacterium]